MAAIEQPEDIDELLEFMDDTEEDIDIVCNVYLYPVAVYHFACFSTYFSPTFHHHMYM